MPKEQWHAVYNLMRECNSAFEIYCDHKSYMNCDLFSTYHSDKIPSDFVAMLKERIVGVKGDMFSELENKAVEKITTICTPQEFCEKLAGGLKKIRNISVCSSLPGNVEVNSLGVSKGSALEKLCERLGIEPNCTAAFGDSGNDIEMLRYAKFGYAMLRPGHDDVRKAARFSVPSNVENGVAVVLNELLR
jgi:HAD superfamily hydrolase (TIGR01484 family)